MKTEEIKFIGKDRKDYSDLVKNDLQKKKKKKKIEWIEKKTL